MACKFIEDLGMFYPGDNSPRKYRYYLVSCPYCKKTFKTRSTHYNAGKLLSCRDCSSGIRDKSIYHRKHGLSRTPIYIVWSGIKSRCNNKHDDAYKNYGGRGVNVCKEWAEDFKKFYDWSMQNGYEHGLDIDRRDNDGDYEPDNCRYVTRFENMSNTRPMRKTNTSGFRGVFKYGKNRFYAKIQLNGAKKNLGVFDTKEQASEAYESARKAKYSNL